MAVIKESIPAKRENIVTIQFLRFVAASLVVLFHSTQALEKHFVGSISSGFAHLANFGGVGVHIFFVISGFIMVYTSFYFKREGFSASKFLVKRIIRIYPIYIIYCLLYLLFHYYFSGRYNISPFQFLGSIILMPGYSSNIIGPGWTLSYEIYFYACFALAMVLGIAKGMWTLTLFFVAAISLSFFINTSQPMIHVITNTLLIEFLLGAWVGFAAVSSVRIGTPIATAMVGASLAGFLSGIVFGYSRLPSVVMWGLPSGLLVSGLVFIEANGRVPTLIKRLSFLGDSSYSLYLLHILLIDAAILTATRFGGSVLLHSHSSATVGMTASLGVTVLCIAISFISYELVEQRIVGNLQRLYRQKLLPAGKNLRTHQQEVPVGKPGQTRL